jgi:hypothetical protein
MNNHAFIDWYDAMDQLELSVDDIIDRDMQVNRDPR